MKRLIALVVAAFLIAGCGRASGSTAQVGPSAPQSVASSQAPSRPVPSTRPPSATTTTAATPAPTGSTTASPTTPPGAKDSPSASGPSTADPQLDGPGWTDVASWTPWPHGIEPPSPRTTCGAAGTTNGTPVVPISVLACFASDVSDCRAGSVLFGVSGVDTGIEMQATLQPGTSPCQATVVLHYYTLNFDGLTSPAYRLMCTISRVAERLHVVCPDNNVADWPIT